MPQTIASATPSEFVEQINPVAFRATAKGMVGAALAYIGESSDSKSIQSTFGAGIHDLTKLALIKHCESMGSLMAKKYDELSLRELVAWYQQTAKDNEPVNGMISLARHDQAILKNLVCAEFWNFLCPPSFSRLGKSDYRRGR